jgi:hypothetical protein
MRRRMAWLAVLAAIAVVSGCTIPTGGGVTTAGIEAGDTDSALLTLPAPPAEDASPAEIIAGFLRAGRGPQENYRVARQYLTDEFREDWQPGARTLISSTPLAPVALADNTWSVAISAGAAVDGQGRYQTASPSDAYDLTFGLVQDEAGQWRISSAPDGTVLPPDRFASIFAPYELYFFDPSYAFLVPDLRWYRQGPSAAGRIVDDLLAGPSDRLGAGALFTAFPEGTRVGETELDGGVAMVDLSAPVGAASTTDQRRMRQQLLQSLRSVTSLRAVEITTGGVILQIPDGGQADSSFLIGNEPIGGVDGAIGVLGSDGGVTPLAGIGTAAGDLGPRGGSILSRDRSRMAVLADAGVVMLEAGQSPVVVDDRAALIAPSLDPLGWTWSVPESEPGALRATSPAGVTVEVPGLPAGGRVVSMDVARDGARLLVALDTPDGPRLVVAGIERDADLAPTRLLTPLDLPVGDAPLLDAAWVDGVTVVVLSDGALTSVDAYDIGGQRRSLGALTDGRSIVGGNTEEGTRVLDAAGNVLRPGGGTSWEDTGADASFLVTQQ